MSTQAEQYKKATEEFLNLVNSLKSSDLDKSDAEGWTPRQVIHHMADSESQSYARLRRLIAEPGTIIQGYDEGLWAENSTLGYKDQPVETAIAIFKAVRQGSYELISRLSAEQLLNAGTHSESGHYTVEKWLQSYTNHPVDHANQIRKQIS
mgnify:CR=1 FL=1|jgi:hypothetical protein